MPFRDNELGPEGAEALAPVLQAMPRLTWLHLGLAYFLHAKIIGTDANYLIPLRGNKLGPKGIANLQAMPGLMLLDLVFVWFACEL